MHKYRALEVLPSSEWWWRLYYFHDDHVSLALIGWTARKRAIQTKALRWLETLDQDGPVCTQQPIILITSEPFHFTGVRSVGIRCYAAGINWQHTCVVTGDYLLIFLCVRIWLWNLHTRPRPGTHRAYLVYVVKATPKRLQAQWVCWHWCESKL